MTRNILPRLDTNVVTATMVRAVRPDRFTVGIHP